MLEQLWEDVATNKCTVILFFIFFFFFRGSFRFPSGHQWKDPLVAPLSRWYIACIPDMKATRPNVLNSPEFVRSDHLSWNNDVQPKMCWDSPLGVDIAGHWNKTLLFLSPFSTILFHDPLYSPVQKVYHSHLPPEWYQGRDLLRLLQQQQRTS